MNRNPGKKSGACKKTFGLEALLLFEKARSYCFSKKLSNFFHLSAQTTQNIYSKKMPSDSEQLDAEGYCSIVQKIEAVLKILDDEEIPVEARKSFQYVWEPQFLALRDLCRWSKNGRESVFNLF